MFQFREPATLGVPWILSKKNNEKVAAIPVDVLKDLKRYDLLSIDFLYQKYQQQYYGVILNEEEGFNMQLQVATFLNVMFNNVEQKFLILILCPNDLILNWHYHLSVHGGLKIIIVGPQTCPEDFDEEHGIALLVSFSNIKLVEPLMEYPYFSIVIDHLDEVASKLLTRKLRGDFNIGLTRRSFYLNPDQKMQWTMMNWCNPGCVGKLSDFYEVDNDNFANFRDNYRHWWFRLTWNYCESFQKPTENELNEYEEKLLEWSKLKSLSEYFRYGKLQNQSNNTSSRNKTSNRKRQVKKEVIQIIKKPKTENISPGNDNCNVNEDSPVEEKVSITGTLNTTSLPASSSPKKEIDDFQNSEDNDVLMSIINNTEVESSSTLSYDAELECKKQEILSQILDDSPRNIIKEEQESEDFLMSLLETDVKQENIQNAQYKSKISIQSVLDEVKSASSTSKDSFTEPANAKSNDIDDILSEAYKLIKK